MVGADMERVALGPAEPISEQQAITDAMHQLPDDGAGYTLIAVQFEPSSKHFNFSGPNGSVFGEDDVKECLVMPPLPPLPFLTPCRYYPVWVVALSNPTCDVVIAINAHTGRFGGAGTGYRGDSLPNAAGSDRCLSAGGGASAPDWWRPIWD
jgi:hypothetical protein